MVFGYLKWWKKDFTTCKKIFILMAPLIIQFIFLSLSTIIDVFIIGNYSSEAAINAAAIGIQIFSIFFFIIISISSGANVYAGQYIGTKQYDKIRETGNFKVGVGFIVVTFILIIFVSIGVHRIVGWILHTSSGQTAENRETIKQATTYLYFLLPVILLSVFNTPFYMSTSLTGKINISMMVAIFVVVLNAGLSFLFVVGMHMNIMGIGLATLISKIISFFIIHIYIVIKKPIWRPNINIFKISKKVLKQCIHGSLGFCISELLYPIFLLLQTFVILKLANEHVYAGFNSVSYVLDLCFASFFGFYGALPFYISKKLGENKLEEARINSQKIIAVSFIITAISSILLFTGFFWYSKILTKLSPEGAQVASWCMLGNCVGIFFYGTALQKFAFLRSGGKTWTASLSDIIPNYCIFLPAFYLLLFFQPLPPHIIFFIMPFFFSVQFILGEIEYYFIKWNRKIID